MSEETPPESARVIVLHAREVVLREAAHEDDQCGRLDLVESRVEADVVEGLLVGRAVHMARTMAVAGMAVT